jgi:hypothetical protein
MNEFVSARRPQFIPKAVNVHKMRPEQIIVTVLPLRLVLSPTLRVIYAAVLEGEAMSPLEAVFVQTHSRPIPRG